MVRDGMVRGRGLMMKGRGFMFLLYILERGQFGFRLDIKKLNGENVHSYVVFGKNAHTKL